MDAIHVKIHPSVRVIKNVAFEGRWLITSVILNHELEEIGTEAFQGCTSLGGIVILNAVKAN